jgi:hypothetical protein
MPPPNPFPITFDYTQISYPAYFDVGGPTPCPQACYRCAEAFANYLKTQNLTVAQLTALGVQAVVGIEWPPGSGTIPFPTPPTQQQIITWWKTNLASRKS